MDFSTTYMVSFKRAPSFLNKIVRVQGTEPTSPLNLLKENFTLLILLIPLKELLTPLLSEPIL